MRISDLIPDKDSLQTRGYWQRRIALGLPAPEYTPLFSAYRANLPSPFVPNAAVNSRVGRKMAAIMPQVLRWRELRMRNRTRRFLLLDSHAGAVEGIRPRGADHNLPPISRPTNPPTKPSEPPPPERKSTPELRYFPPGDRFSQGQFPIKNEILRTAPSIDWSYAVIERTDPHTLATSLIPFSLGKAVLDHNPSQNLQFQSGDVVTVFSTSDIQVPQAQRVKYVSLQGEIVHAGIYSVEPGETLRDVVKRAGGLTPKAYLYGSEFLRESTQRLQQARLNEYVNSLERDIQLSGANAAGSLVNAYRRGGVENKHRKSAGFYCNSS